jgi:hypothetical protein
LKHPGADPLQVENQAGIKPQRTRRAQRIIFKEILSGPLKTSCPSWLKAVLALTLGKILFNARRKADGKNCQIEIKKKHLVSQCWEPGQMSAKVLSTRPCAGCLPTVACA